MAACSCGSRPYARPVERASCASWLRGQLPDLPGLLVDSALTPRRRSEADREYDGLPLTRQQRLYRDASGGRAPRVDDLIARNQGVDADTHTGPEASIRKREKDDERAVVAVVIVERRQPGEQPEPGTDAETPLRAVGE